MIGIVATHHTSFTVSDLDTAIALFRDTLGFEVTARKTAEPAIVERLTGVPQRAIRLAFVSTPGHQIELVEYQPSNPPAQPRRRINEPGAAHIAFVVADLDRALEKVLGAGLHMNGAVLGERGKTRSAYVHTDDGIQFEFFENPPTPGFTG